MTWPTTPVSTTNLDQGTDSPALARAQIKSAVDSVNAIAQEFGNVDLSSPSTNDVIAWDGSQWVAAAPSAGSTYGDANVASFLSTSFGSNTITTTGNITGGNIIGDGSSLTNTPEKSIALVGDATASGTTGSNVSVTLANTTVTAGTYGSATEVAQITIDSKGRITSAANVTITGGGGGSGSAGAFALLQASSHSDENTGGERIWSWTEVYDGGNIITLNDASTLYPGAFRSFSVAESGTYMIETTGWGVNNGADINVNLVSGTMSTVDNTLLTDMSTDGTITYAGSSERMWIIYPKIVSLSGPSTRYIFKNQNTTFSDATGFPIAEPRLKITRLS